MALWRLGLALGRKEVVVWYSMYFTNNHFDTVLSDSLSTVSVLLFNKDYNGSIRFSYYPEAIISDCIELALCALLAPPVAKSDGS